MKETLVDTIYQKQLDWANGTFTSSSVDGTAQLNSEAIGAVRAYAQICYIDYDDLVEGLL